MSGSFNGTGFRDQLDRVERYLERVRNQNQSHTDYDDDLWSFFIHAWHLKDWVKADEPLPSDARHRIVSEAENIRELQICADLANRTKHLLLDRFSRHDSAPARRDVTIGLGANSTVKSTHYIRLKDDSQVI
ncbi:MAG: hypothetical protein AAFY15_08960, partial [Cyanobacteria bacterium J06648_11]